MIIAARYSFNNGEQYIKQKFPGLLREVEGTVGIVDASNWKILFYGL